MDKLIRKEDALELLFSKWEPKRQTERVSVTQAAGRILAEDIFAAYNLPVVRASRMDGIAVHSSVFANGKPDTSGWKPGVDYIRADTGDDFDDAYDAVIAIEQVTFLPEGGLRLSDDVQVSAGSCVKPCGADLKQGSLIAKAGTVLHAQTLAAAAMSGVAELTVVKKPQVAFIPTGSELVKVGSALKRGQNFDTNSILVQQMLQDMGAEPILHPIVPDDPNAIRAALESVWEQSDIVLINAGTSKGGEDYSFRILEEAGETNGVCSWRELESWAEMLARNKEIRRKISTVPELTPYQAALKSLVSHATEDKDLQAELKAVIANTFAAS